MDTDTAEACVFSERIKAVRIGRGKTQEEFAAMLGYNRLQIIRWERGHSIPDDAAMETIAFTLGVTTAYLRGLVGSPQEKMSDVQLSPLEKLVIAAQRLREANDAVQAALDAFSASERHENGG